MFHHLRVPDIIRWGERLTTDPRSDKSFRSVVQVPSWKVILLTPTIFILPLTDRLAICCMSCCMAA